MLGSEGKVSKDQNNELLVPHSIWAKIDSNTPSPTSMENITNDIVEIKSESLNCTKSNSLVNLKKRKIIDSDDDGDNKKLNMDDSTPINQKSDKNTLEFSPSGTIVIDDD